MTFSLADTCPNKSAGHILDELEDKVQKIQTKKQNKVFMLSNERRVCKKCELYCKIKNWPRNTKTVLKHSKA